MFISAIVVAYNEEKNIRVAIESLLSQNYPKEKFEVILVSDGSTDNTIQQALAYPQVKTIKLSKNYGISFARNIGVLEARGDIVFFLDADMKLKNDAFKKIEERFTSIPNLTALCGKYNCSNKGLNGIWNIRKEVKSNKGNKSKFIKLTPFTSFSSGISAFKREELLKIGLFDESFRSYYSEDLWLELKLLAKKYILLYEPAVQGIHFSKKTNLSSILSQGIRSVRGRYKVICKAIQEEIPLPKYDNYIFRLPFWMFVVLPFTFIKPIFFNLFILTLIMEGLSLVEFFFPREYSFYQKLIATFYYLWCDIIFFFYFFYYLIKETSNFKYTERVRVKIFHNKYKRIKTFCLKPYFQSKIIPHNRLKHGLFALLYLGLWGINPGINPSNWRTLLQKKDHGHREMF